MVYRVASQAYLLILSHLRSVGMAGVFGRHWGSVSYKSPGLRQRRASYDARAATTYLGRDMRCPYEQCLWRNSHEFPPWGEPGRAIMHRGLGL